MYKKYLTVFFALTSLSTREVSKKKNSISFHLGMKATTLDPGRIIYIQEHTIASLIYDRLVKVDDEGNVCPAAADSWEVKGDKVIFHIKKSAKWSDGKKITAHHFALAIKRVLNPATGAYNMTLVEGLGFAKNAKGEPHIEALSDDVLEMKFNRKLEGSILTISSILSVCACSPIREDMLDSKGDFIEVKKNLLSSGPWMIESMESPQNIKLVKNPHYHDSSRIKIDNINIYIISNPHTSFKMYENNELDIYLNTNLAKEHLKHFQDKGELIRCKDGYFNYLKFNCNHEILSNVNVRKAISLAIDRRVLADIILLKTAVPALGIVPPGYKGSKGDFREEAGDLFKNNDVEEAKRLLAIGKKELGIDKIELSVDIISNVILQKISQFVAQELKNKLDIDVKIEIITPAQTYERMKTGARVLSFYRWEADYAVNPLSFVNYLKSTHSGKASEWKNEKFDQLIDKAEGSSNFQKLSTLLKEAERIVCDQKDGEFPICPLSFTNRSFAVKRHLKNVRIYPGSYRLDLVDAYLED